MRLEPSESSPEVPASRGSIHCQDDYFRRALSDRAPREFFNAFNHTSFANPINGPENPNFGRTFSTAISSRTIQLGLKFYWWLTVRGVILAIPLPFTTVTYRSAANRTTGINIGNAASIH